MITRHNPIYNFPARASGRRALSGDPVVGCVRVKGTGMTPRQADKIIREGKPVTVINTQYPRDGEWTATFIRRDRWNIYTDVGGFDRGDLEIVKTL